MMKLCGLAVLLMCGMGADWSVYYNNPPVPVLVQPPAVVTHPYYTLNYVPIVKQEIVMVPVVQQGVVYGYYYDTRWVPQPAPWESDPYVQWLRCKQYRY
jgi:hypothetical protein